MLTGILRRSVLFGALLCVSAGFSLCLSGCSPTGQSPVGVVRGRQGGKGGSPSVVASAAYQSASADFAGHRVASALGKVKALLGNPDISPADRTFLLRQQAICEATLAGKPIAAVVNPKSARPQSAASVRKLTAMQADCGPRALLRACEQMGVTASLPALREAAGTTGDGTNLAGLIRAAQSVGVHAEGVQMDGAALANLDTDKAPALAWVDGNHFVTVLSVHGDSATIHDPNRPQDEDISLTSGPTGLLARSGGILLRLSKTPAGNVRAANKAAGV